MEKRSRNNMKIFYLNDTEWKFIQKKMQVAHTTNFSSFTRKMLMDGLIIHKDFSDLKETIVQLNRIGNNLNQIARKVNQTNAVNRGDMIMVLKNYDDLMVEVNQVLLKRIYEDRLHEKLWQ